MKNTQLNTVALHWVLAIAAGGFVTAPSTRAADAPVPPARPITAAAAVAVAPDHTPAAAPADEIRRGLRMGGSPEERQRQAYDQAARRVEPSLKGTPERLPAYLEFFKRDFVRDPRVFAFNAQAEPQSDGSVVLTGYAEYPEHKQSLERLLAALGFDKVRNDIEQLPSANLGDARFAIVSAPHALMYDKPAKPRETVTEAMIGDRLWLLKATDDGYFLCHSGEGYTGYIERAKVKVVSNDAFVAHQNGDHGTMLADAGDKDHFLPAGARLAWRGEKDGRATLADVAGNVYSVPRAIVKPPAPHRNSLIERVIANAFNLQGTPYVWGGRTSAGVDCSGLVQTSFGAHGVYLPRDADQQSLVGLLVANRQCRDGLRRGDVLFFLSKRGTVHHTAIYLGNNQYIEAASPGAKVTSLDPAAPNYDKRRDETFCFAKRFVE
jgi:cell wall-associated NlpC family hydrolase